MSHRVIEKKSEIETCYYCRDAFRNLTLHWSNGRCSHPRFGPVQKGLITGLLLYKGYFGTKDGDRNSSLLCAFESKSMARQLYIEFGDHSLRVDFIDGEEYFGNTIVRKYVLTLRSHPYISELRSNWCVKNNKSVPETVEYDTVSTYDLMYRLVGKQGFDGHDWMVFDTSYTDAEPYHFRNMLEEYNSFVYRDDQKLVVLRNTQKFRNHIQKYSQLGDSQR
jgi:hypothetical protein